MHKELAECGTSAAYRRHRRAGEDCAVCREAEAVRGREKRQRRREASDRELLSGASVVVEQKMRAGTEPVMLQVPTGEDPLVSAVTLAYRGLMAGSRRGGRKWVVHK